MRVDDLDLITHLHVLQPVAVSFGDRTGLTARHEGPAHDPKPMPPKDKLSDSDIGTITEWIRAGAVMPDEQAHQAR